MDLAIALIALSMAFVALLYGIGNAQLFTRQIEALVEIIESLQHYKVDMTGKDQSDDDQKEI